MTKSWGLEVDRVELTMEAVLQPPRETPAGPPAAAPPVPGLEGTAQQLAAHFFGSTLALAGSVPGTPEAGEEAGSTSSFPRGCPSCMPRFNEKGLGRGGEDLRELGFGAGSLEGTEGKLGK